MDKTTDIKLMNIPRNKNKTPLTIDNYWQKALDIPNLNQPINISTGFKVFKQTKR